MKLLIRISSIRRHAWKQCRSCSADSDSMCCDSLARCSLPGWMRSPSALEHARDRVLGEPVDLEPVDEVAQLAGDRDVALGVAEADRRGDVERALAAVAAVHGRVAPRRAVDELAQREVHLHGLARVREVAGALDGLEPAAGDLRERLAVGVGRDLVLRCRGSRGPGSGPARRAPSGRAASQAPPGCRARGQARGSRRRCRATRRPRPRSAWSSAARAASSPPTTARSRHSRRCASSAGLNLPQPRVVSGGFVRERRMRGWRENAPSAATAAG